MAGSVGNPQLPSEGDNGHGDPDIDPGIFPLFFPDDRAATWYRARRSHIKGIDAP